MISETTVQAAGQFNQTHWSVVLLAAGQPSLPASAALEKLCQTYWHPLYAFVRRRGYTAHDAQDLTQEFFARLIAKDYLHAVDRSKGKFRSFLLASLEHFIANEWRRAHTQKRGGKFSFASIDDESAEQPFLQLAVSYLSPEHVFDRQWAVTLLGETVAKLREEFVTAGKGRLFEAIKIFLTGEKPPETYAQMAAILETNEAALKMSVSRMRRRYGELLRAEIATTVTSPDEADEELRALFKALS